MINIYWFGYGGTSSLAEQLRPLIQELKMRLVTIHEWDNADVKWNRETLLDELRKADIIILPTNYQEQPAKSNNRLTQALSLGKPVICSPLDSYLKILEKFPDSFLIAKEKEEWKQQLTKLKNNENLRNHLSEKALEASQDYSVDSISHKWIDLFINLEKVDIVIPTYNNLPCLKLCIDSIRSCTNVLYNIIVVNNGPDEDVHKYLAGQGNIVYIKKEKLNFAQAINLGIKAGKSKYVCLLNDDVIVSKNWLKKMVEVCKDNIGAVGPFSNCDKGWLHNFDVFIKDVELLPGLNTPKQIVPIIEDIYNYQSDYTDAPRRDWVAFYCTLIPRHVINHVGLLDEKFTNSGEDVDYCFRIRKMGYRIIQNYESFVFHFGAVGRKILEKEDKEKYQENDRKTNIYLDEKWSQENVVIYTGPSWEKWDFRNIDKGGIGGSETWAICLAKELKKLKYRVKIFCDCPESGIINDDIEYLHYTNYPDYINHNWIDYFITSRTTDPLKFPIRCKKIFVMIHDIGILGENDIPLFLDRVDKYCVLSQWHKDFVKDHHKIPEEKIWITSNGLDFSRFNGKVKKEPHRLIYSSSPDRGLDNLLYLFAFMRREIKDLELHIFYGFDNWAKSIRTNGNESEIKSMKKIKKWLKLKNVFYHGRIGQKELAQEFSKSSLWAYPTDFEETFCITAIEAQAAGIPVITSNYAGLKTTVGDSGILIGNGQKGEPYTKEYRIEFAEKCIEVLSDKEKWNHLSRKSLENSKKYSWNNVVSGWDLMFKT